MYKYKIFIFYHLFISPLRGMSHFVETDPPKAAFTGQEAA